MSKELATNGDYMDAFTSAARDHIAALAAYVRARPDEAAVTVTPILLIVLATARHNLNFVERLLLSEVGYLAGLLAVAEYKRWKQRPAGPGRLRKVAG